MSIDIHISNYEEYLCSYVDGELSPEEIAALELFLDQHPHLRTELNQLMATRLQPEDLVFAGKAALYKSSQAEDYESRLLSYMDGELDEQAAKELELFMEAHPPLRQELELWEKTRVVPDMSVRFEDKSALYRYSSRTVRMRPAYWWAAAAMLAGALFLLRNTFTQDDAGLPVAATSGTSMDSGQLVLAEEGVKAGRNDAGDDNAASNNSIAGNNAVTGNNTVSDTRVNNTIAGNNAVSNNSAATRANNVISGNTVLTNSATRANNAIAGNNTVPTNSAAAHGDIARANAIAGNNTIPDNTASITANNTFAAANAADLSSLRTRSAPVRNLRQAVNTALSGDIPEVKDPEMLAMNNKPSIEIKTAANLATAAPAPPPGELIMSVTGNGLESKVLDKVTNVAKLFSRKRNNK